MVSDNGMIINNSFSKTDSLYNLNTTRENPQTIKLSQTIV